MKTERIVEEMEDHNEEGRASSQAIEHFKVLFAAAGAVDNYG
jgi:hypothetical protein